MRKRIVVGSRGSKLAMIQTESVVAKLRGLVPEVEVNITKVVTQGDRNTSIQLDLMEGVGVFVKELEEALLDRRIDLVVHSLKDVPTEIPEGLVLIAVTERADPRDVLVTKSKRLAELPSGAKIGTGSLRRAVQITNLRPDVEPHNIRGNVDTRLRKVDTGEFGGLITAAAAMIRLGLQARISEYLPLEHFLPAVGQGALVVETRRDDKEINEVLSRLNHLPTWQSITAERAFLFALGGGCRAPIAALGTVNGDALKLEGMIASVGQKRMLRAEEEGSALSGVEIGKRLARKLLDMGGTEFLTEVEMR